MEKREIAVISTELLLDTAERIMESEETSLFSDEIPVRLVEMLKGILLSHCEIDLGLSDLKSLVRDEALASFASTYAQGESAASIAATFALNATLQPELIARRLLVHIRFHPEYPFADITKALDLMESRVQSNGMYQLEDTATLQKDQVEIVIIATGIEVEEL